MVVVSTAGKNNLNTNQTLVVFILHEGQLYIWNQAVNNKIGIENKKYAIPTDSSFLRDLNDEEFIIT